MAEGVLENDSQSDLFHLARNRVSLRESVKDKLWSRRIGCWVNTRSPTRTCCSAIALDLANREWDRQNTHRYVLAALQVQRLAS
jgi:hypothetical protein